MWIIVSCLVVIILYFAAIMPRMVNRPDDSHLQGWFYAHRGLHDNQSDAPENSMAAIRKAVEAGYGIEFDVQLTKDRIPVVFHDETLKRVCGEKGNVRDYTYRELQQFRLLDSGEQIPLFTDVLEFVNGQVPLIIEIKVHEDYSKVCSHVDVVLETYKGAYCIESFQPQAVRWYKKHRPEVVRGQLSCQLNGGKERFSLAKWAATNLLANFISKPDFIAYDHKYAENVSRKICRNIYKALSVAWTIRSQEELEKANGEFDLFIFEGFIPKK